MSDEKHVMKYFNSTAADFDDIYEGKRSALMRRLNHLLRKDMYRRFDVVMQELGDLTGKSVLDVGCGSGRFAHACAKQGAERVVGIDFAPNMISIASRLAGEMGVSETCEFMAGDLMETEFEAKSFDVALAIGLFDYIRDPAPVLEKINRITSEKVYSTFPAKWVLRAPIRKVRLTLSGCPVYFFSKGDMKRFFAPPGTKSWRMLFQNQIYVIESLPS